MYSMFLLSYRNTRENLGELEKAVETLACSLCSLSISCSPKLPLVFLELDRNTVYVFYFLGKKFLQRKLLSDNKNSSFFRYLDRFFLPVSMVICNDIFAYIFGNVHLLFQLQKSSICT